MKMKTKIVVVTVVAAVVILILLRAREPDRLHTGARKQWKQTALVSIAEKWSDAKWLATETNGLIAKMAQEHGDLDGWVSGQLILMKNGEWIVFANKCGKEGGGIHDIFIGRGSNGKWYYSTYHFCVRMISLSMDERTESLGKFVKNYFLREFDGHSDECLEKTWPPERG